MIVFVAGYEKPKPAPETQRVLVAMRRRADPSEPLRRNAVMDDAGSDDGRDRRRVHVGDSDFLARKLTRKSLESSVISVFVALHSLTPFGTF